MSIVTNGLLSYWGFEDTLNATQGTSQVNGALANGTAIYSQGVKVVGKAIDLNGVSNINVDSSAWQTLSAISVDYWVKAGSLSGGTTGWIFDFGNFASGNALYSYINTSEYVLIYNNIAEIIHFNWVSGNINPYVWNHICWIHTGATWYLFINKVLRAKYNQGTSISLASTTNRIGSKGDNTLYATAAIDDFKIYNRALTISTTTVGETDTGEVAQNYDDRQALSLTTPEGKMSLVDSSNSVVSISPQGNFLVPKPNIVTRGLVSYWALEEDSMASGGIKDTAFLYGVGGKSKDGTRAGSAPISNNGILGKCHQFTEDDNIRIPDNALTLTTTAQTWEYWVYLYNYPSSGYYSLLGKYSMGIMIDTSGYLYLSGMGSDITGTTVVPLNQWVHIVVSFEGNVAVHSWVNTIKESVTRAGSYPSTNATNVYFGTYSNGSSYALKGLLDEVKFYSVTLTDNEVQQNYQAYGSRIATKGLVSWWKLKDNAKDCAKVWSASGGNNDGVMTNGTWFDPVNGAKFGNITDAIAITNSVDVTSTFTVMGWVNVTSGGSSQKDLICGANWEFGVANPTYLYLQANLGGWVNYHCTSGSVLNAGWSHVAMSFNQTAPELKFYVNGVLVNSFTPASGLSTTSSLTLGNYNGTARGLNGYLRDTMLYNRVLSVGEIQMNYSAGRSK